MFCIINIVVVFIFAPELCLNLIFRSILYYNLSICFALFASKKFVLGSAWLGATFLFLVLTFTPFALINQCQFLYNTIVDFPKISIWVFLIRILCGYNFVCGFFLGKVNRNQTNPQPKHETNAIWPNIVRQQGLFRTES